jgi:hypothetical protein
MVLFLRRFITVWGLYGRYKINVIDLTKSNVTLPAPKCDPGWGRIFVGRVLL